MGHAARAGPEAVASPRRQPDGPNAFRDEARDDSDLDLLVDFEVGPTFDSFLGLKFFLEDHLGRKVDLVTHQLEAAVRRLLG